MKNLWDVTRIFFSKKHSVYFIGRIVADGEQEALEVAEYVYGHEEGRDKLEVTPYKETRE